MNGTKRENVITRTDIRSWGWIDMPLLGHVLYGDNTAGNILRRGARSSDYQGSLQKTEANRGPSYEDLLKGSSSSGKVKRFSFTGIVENLHDPWAYI